VSFVDCAVGEAYVNTNNSSSSLSGSFMNDLARQGNMRSAHVSLRSECSVTETATRQVGSPALTMVTQTSQAQRRGQRTLRLLELIGILLREEYKRARAPGESENMELQDRVRRFDQALSHHQVPSTEQMREWALRLVGVDNGMSENAKSQLTLAFQTHFMLVRAARRTPHSLFERFNLQDRRRPQRP